MDAALYQFEDGFERVFQSVLLDLGENHTKGHVFREPMNKGGKLRGEKLEKLPLEGVSVKRKGFVKVVIVF